WPRALALSLFIPLFAIGLIALLVAINSSAKAERRSWAFAGKLWRSRFTRVFFRAAGIAIRPEDRATPSAIADPTRLELPDAARRNLPELPALLERYERTLVDLRKREENVERALAEVGAARADGAAGLNAPNGPDADAEW